MQLAHTSSIFFFFFSLLLLLGSIATVESTTSPNPKTPLDDFINKSCQVTLYPDLCYSSLSSSYTGDPDLGKLTYAAINISHAEAIHAADYVMTLSNKKTSTGDDEAILDCVELTEESVQQVRKSRNQMATVLRSGSRAQKKDEREKRKRRFEMSNVQTWMSAAITDQNTCIDGFSDDKGGKKDDEEEEVTMKVRMVVKFISNALALVNSFVDATL
ncbi:hypothetical protein SOVF_112410 [Spinacia oleracea]|nr:hypothetical protein SOVF_112410 [Spinacia oleracea]